MKASRFEIRDRFYLDGKPFKIISGSIHYFRVVPEYWRDRLEKLRAMGCNTVETYIPWNFHEPKRGEFLFEGWRDIAAFLKIAQEVGLWAIVRPSPYICAEWEFGGLPAWLLADDGMRLRSSYPPFLEAVKEYYSQLFKILTPLQIDNGGPILMMQVENEYGSFGNEKAYLKFLRDEMRENGVTVPLVTSDGPWMDYLEAGSVEGAHPTVNFGSKAAEHLKMLKNHFKSGGPTMAMEFWPGWFDAWGNGRHSTTNVKENSKDLDEILSQGSSNLYMFHGGTNFGFMNGSNYYEKLVPDVTSYDYDAPLSEDGEIMPKYRAFQKVIAKYAEVPKMTFSTKIEKRSYGKQKVSDRVSLFSVLEDISSPTESPWPLPMEKLGQNYGYTLYRSAVNKEISMEKLQLLGANDRAQIFLDKRPFLTLYDHELEKEYEISGSNHNFAELDILVENMGRVNYGPRLENQRKGIQSSVLLNGHGHSGWKMYPLEIDATMLKKLDFTREYQKGTPAFYRITFQVEEKGDTFLDLSGWGKGCALLNGFNLGRFWEKGPQKRLYVPAPLLRQGENELIIFETEGKTTDFVQLLEKPALG